MACKSTFYGSVDFSKEGGVHRVVRVQWHLMLVVLVDDVGKLREILRGKHQEVALPESEKV